MKGMKQLSIRCSGLMTEAQLRNGIDQDELAKFMDLSDRTLREKSRTKEMYTLALGKIAVLADLAGYEIDFVPKGRRAAG